MRKTHLQKQFTALVLILSFLGVKGWGQSITAGTGFNICGRAASGIYSTRPTNADFNTGTGEVVTDIVTTTNTGAAIDFDADGFNEVVIRTIGNSTTSSTQTRFYIFEATANNNYSRQAIQLVDQGLSGSSPGLSKGLDVGNIDGDASMEIVLSSGISSSNYVTAYDISTSFTISELAQSICFGSSGIISGSSGTINTIKIVPSKNGSSNADILLSQATSTITHLAAIEINGSVFDYLTSGAMANYNGGVYAFTLLSNCQLNKFNCFTASSLFSSSVIFVNT